MKYVIIVLLVAALGAGVYYYSGKRQTSSSLNSKELILGKWKMDSMNISRSRDSSLGFLALVFAAADSNLHKYEFDFQKGRITESLNGKAGDTSYYEFVTSSDLLLWAKADTAKTKWMISKLDSSSLVMQSKDSIVFSFRRIEE